jgi:(S)-beta-tyrosine adenylation enzyme
VNDAATGPAFGRRANDRVRAWARITPDAPALVCDGVETSYRQLLADAGAVTRALAGAERRPVAVRMAAGRRLVAAVQGVLDAGAHPVCLGPAEVGGRGWSMLSELRPSHLLLDGEPADDLADRCAAELGVTVVDVAALAPGAAPAVVGSTAELAYATYTSGSTGVPKGVPQRHATLVQFVSWFAEEFAIGPGSRIAQWAAPGYDAALVEVYAALSAGATLFPVPEHWRPNPDKLVDWLADNRITLLQTVPSFARRLLHAVTERSAAGRLDALDHLLLAGETLSAELANDVRATLPRVRLVNLYGPTETILATWHDVTGPVTGTVPIGRAIPGRDVRVQDRAGSPCPPGETGEIVIHSPHVTPGYLGGHPPLPAGPYHTGDLGRLRPDGLLEFAGRQDSQVKVNGIRLELTDVEAVLATDETVAECAVVPVFGADGLAQRLVVLVVPEQADGRPAAARQRAWRTTLRRHYGRTMLPVVFETVPNLPRGAGGKVDRRRLAEDLRGRADPADR